MCLSVLMPSLPATPLWLCVIAQIMLQPHLGHVALVTASLSILLDVSGPILGGRHGHVETDRNI